jgi:hypothetical protein
MNGDNACRIEVETAGHGRGAGPGRFACQKLQDEAVSRQLTPRRIAARKLIAQLEARRQVPPNRFGHVSCLEDCNGAVPDHDAERRTPGAQPDMRSAHVGAHTNSGADGVLFMS